MARIAQPAPATAPLRGHRGSTRRGTSPGSQRALAASRARRIQQGKWLREALTALLDAAEALGRSPKAKELQWALKDAGPAGQAYLEAAGYPDLRVVQQHLKVIRAARSQRFVFDVSELRDNPSTLPRHDRGSDPSGTPRG